LPTREQASGVVSSAARSEGDRTEHDSREERLVHAVERARGAPPANARHPWPTCERLLRGERGVRGLAAAEEREGAVHGGAHSGALWNELERALRSAEIITLRERRGAIGDGGDRRVAGRELAHEVAASIARRILGFDEALPLRGRHARAFFRAR